MPKLPPINPERIDEWQTIRAEAAKAFEAVIGAGPDPKANVMGAIAWRSQFPFHNDLVMHNLVMRAREERWSWREISAAAGEGSTDEDVTRVTNRHTHLKRAQAAKKA